MPELPEVETTLRGIEPYLVNQKIRQLIVRNGSLRWPVPAQLPVLMAGQRIIALERRAKYLLLKLAHGTAILHLGMSGNLRIVEASTPVGKHDHVDLILQSGKILRFNDPRRFGCLLWHSGPEPHSLLAALGPEPLTDAFDGDRLYRRSRGRKAPVKTFIMDNKIVVGVGNIYANEALFAARVRPGRAAGQISLARYERLAGEIKEVLTRAIAQGGTTLKDFVGGDGKPGYFKQQLKVYGRAGLGCVACQRPLTEVRLGQRSTVFCKHCQR